MCGKMGSSRPRLQVMMMMATVCIVLFLSLSYGVFGAPNMGPDMYTCKQNAVVPPHNVHPHCCPPLPARPIKDFSFEDQPFPMRVRRAAHKVDAEYIAKYNKAYELMRALPNDDPRSFHQQANTHCSYCGFGFKQLGINVTLEMHGTWLTFPFHRWYIYFHERILASLINDPTFALPFWNWDNMIEPERPSQIPSYFYTEPALIDPLRNPNHRTPAIPDLSTTLGGLAPNENASIETIIQTNNNLMYSTVVTGATLPYLFLGKPLRGGIEKTGLGASAFEVGPHGAIHGWVGDNRQPNGEDMVHLYSAARDPIFYAHHANCDRLWNSWKEIPGGKRTGFEDDEDWLESRLLFYDENADLVRVKIRDSLDNEKLKYTYEEVDNPWLRHQPVSYKKEKSNTLASVSTIASWLSAGSELLSSLRNTLKGTQGEVTACDVGSENITFSDSAYHTFVRRDPQAAQGRSIRRLLGAMTSNDDLVAEEVLEIVNIQVLSGMKANFDIFLDADADTDTPLTGAEYVATYTNMPLRPDTESQKSVKVTFPVAIGMKLKTLGLENEVCVPISLVPKVADDAVAPEIAIERLQISTVVA